VGNLPILLNLSPLQTWSENAVIVPVTFRV